MKNKILKLLFYPSAFKVGSIVTLLFCYISIQFYSGIGGAPRVLRPLLESLSIAHQKSIDLRLKSRGERHGSDKVAMIVVDELAVEKLGRWPWPRDRIAQVIDRLFGYGAQVLGFDAIFSESDTHQTIESLNRIKSLENLPEHVKSALDKEIQTADKDMILAQIVGKHADKLVMGGYYDMTTDNFDAYQEPCAEIYIRESQSYKNIERDEVPILALDEFPAELPEAFTQIITEVFKKIERQIREKERDPRNANEESDLQNKIHEAKQAYCDRFLTSKDEQLQVYRKFWPQIQKTASEYSNIPFDQLRSFLINSKFLSNPVLRTAKWWTNIPAIVANTKHTGSFNATQDGDGTIRRTSLVSRYGGKYMASLALKMFMLHKNSGLLLTLGQDPADPTSKFVKEISLTDLETGEPKESLPIDGQGRLAINYAGPKYMFPHLSVSELFNDKETVQITLRRGSNHETREVKKADFIKDKLFLFGATATGIFDMRVTPFDENYPGLETHANVLDNLLRRDFLMTPSNEGTYVVATLLVIGLLLTFALKNLGASSGAIFTASLVAIVYLYDRFYLFRTGKVVAVVLPLLLIASVYVLLTFYKYFTEERKKQALKGTFQKYVSPAIVNEILKDPSNLELGGKKLRMSVMFSDVRGFTTISEKLDPQVLTRILNTYLTPMTRLVFDNKGTLDKYMGDAIMAFFGAPVTYPDHAKMACRCALQMMEKLREIQIDFRAKNLPDIDIGIGINTGDMNVGNMGSDIVRSYTVMGDSVNLGSRLEGINKQYGTHIIISEFTYGDIKDDFVAREIDWVRVKGKLLPVRIFELIGEKKSVQATSLEMLTLFELGFQKYHQKAWVEAIDIFTKALNLSPEDPPTKLYIERCREYLTEPPEDNWDGVFEMKTK